MCGMDSVGLERLGFEAVGPWQAALGPGPPPRQEAGCHVLATGKA